MVAKALNKEPFELLELLGTGAFAQTWRAQVIDAELREELKREEVAIKIPLDKKKERVLRRELVLTGSLHMRLTEIESRNIVKYLGFEVFEGKIVMIMEYISGGNLRDFMKRWEERKLTEIIEIAVGILEGLSVIHKRHIIHRDIKPENILMEGMTPKIGDLGISRMLETNELASTRAGTLYYMAPELLCKPAQAYFNADLWSFGVILYELICGQLPFGITFGTPLGDVADLIRDEKVKLIFPSKANIPSFLQEINSKLLERNPEKRFKTPDEVIKEIRKYFPSQDEEVEKEIALVQNILSEPSKVSVIEKKLNEIVSKFPSSSRSYLYLGEFYNKVSQFKKAINIFNKGLEKFPANPLLLWGLAIAYLHEGDNSLAIDTLEKAIKVGLEQRLERQARILLDKLRADLKNNL